MRLRMMRRFFGRTGLAIGLCLATMTPGTVHATPLAVIANIPVEAVLAMSAANMRCVSITFDKNGNRLSQVDTSVTTTPTQWGAGTYGCFVWTP
jgi:hypothetical protein